MLPNPGIPGTNECIKSVWFISQPIYFNNFHLLGHSVFFEETATRSTARQADLSPLGKKKRKVPDPKKKRNLNLLKNFLDFFGRLSQGRWQADGQREEAW